MGATGRSIPEVHPETQASLQIDRVVSARQLNISNKIGHQKPESVICIHVVGLPS